MRKLGLGLSYEDYVNQYGEDNAKYILETLGDGLQNYCQYGYIEMNLPGGLSYESETQDDAVRRDWSFAHLQGDLSLLQKLVDGQWDEDDFVILSPGECLTAVSDGRIIDKATGSAS